MSVGQPVQYLPLDGDAEIKENTSGGMAVNDNVKSQIENGEPMAAIITRIWSPSCVNLIIFPDCSHPVIRTSVSQGTGRGNWNYYLQKDPAPESPVTAG